MLVNRSLSNVDVFTERRSYSTHKDLKTGLVTHSGGITFWPENLTVKIYLKYMHQGIILKWYPMNKNCDSGDSSLVLNRCNAGGTLGRNILFK